MLTIPYREFGCNVLRTQFPFIHARYQASIKSLAEKGQIRLEWTLDGTFLQICPNQPEDGKDVINDPHADSKNLALGICMLFIYARSGECLI
jgi:hypothetical protein